MHGTPMSVGSPQEVIEKTLSFQEGFGDYQRQLWIVDHAGLPLEEALEQVELLGTEVVPVLRKEMESRRAPASRTRRPMPPWCAPSTATPSLPAAPERQPRRQRHRHLALPGLRPGARRQPPTGRVSAVASRTRIANEAWEALFRAQSTVIRELQSRRRVGTDQPDGVRRALCALEGPGRVADQRPRRRRAAHPGRASRGWSRAWSPTAWWSA